MYYICVHKLNHQSGYSIKIFSFQNNKKKYFKWNDVLLHLIEFKFEKYCIYFFFNSYSIVLYFKHESFKLLGFTSNLDIKWNM